MPRAMNLVLPMEIVITPGTTYILMEYLSMLRRIYTDGRSFPTDEDPSWMGYSIGKWIDESAPAASTCSQSRPQSQEPAHVRSSGCCCTGTARPSSMSGSISTRPTRHPARRDHGSRPRAHSPLDGGEEHAARAQADLGRNRFARGQRPRQYRISTTCSTGDGELMPSKKDAAGARFEAFQPAQEVERLNPSPCKGEGGERNEPAGVSPLGGFSVCDWRGTPTRRYRADLPFRFPFRWR